MTHTSKCTLVSSLGSLYTPGSCDGDPSCSCQSGACTCTGTCTSTGARTTLFGASGGTENVAWQSSFNAVNMFYMWLHEETTDPACQFTMENGHRWNILKFSGAAIGVGCTNNYCTQDFGGPAAASNKISVGVHYPATGTVAFRAHWYDTAAPSQALVNIGGACTAMTKERGVNDNNATYLLANQAISGCTRYYFMFKDSGGTLVTYPETGLVRHRLQRRLGLDAAGRGHGLQLHALVCGQDLRRRRVRGHVPARMQHQLHVSVRQLCVRNRHVRGRLLCRRSGLLLERVLQPCLRGQDVR